MTKEQIIEILEKRFLKDQNRFKDITFDDIKKRLNETHIKSLIFMEETKGEPTLWFYDQPKDKYIFVDMSKESPIRRSVCYDEDARLKRTKFPPEFSALGLANQYHLNLLDENMYFKLQTLGPFDQKTSSWLLTPSEIRNLSGALFGDYKYGRVFTYHNGADSYYSSRGFRVYIEV